MALQWTTYAQADQRTLEAISTEGLRFVIVEAMDNLVSLTATRLEDKRATRTTVLSSVEEAKDIAELIKVEEVKRPSPPTDEQR